MPPRKGSAPKHGGEKKRPPRPGEGRPSSYRAEFVEQAGKLCKLGATDEDIAEFFNVSARTLYRWAAAHPEFCQALKVSKEPADDRVERSLYHRACGYTFDAVKIMTVGGEVKQVPYKEHVPPDTTAAIFWLKNRRKDEWRDRPDGAGQPDASVTIVVKGGLPSPADE